jgi:DNA-binding transcriptional LysR family regulator
MGFKLPPLSSVRVFEAAARHGSFKKAAEELNITASAVSHAVQNLEDWLGVALFQRGGGKLGLTEPGAAYAVAVGEALKAVAEATARLPGRRSHGRLAVSSAPGFAARWLLPRLSRFTERYPETGVDIETSLKAVDLPMEGIDAAIRLAPASRHAVVDAAARRIPRACLFAEPAGEACRSVRAQTHRKRRSHPHDVSFGRLGRMVSHCRRRDACECARRTAGGYGQYGARSGPPRLWHRARTCAAV